MLVVQSNGCIGTAVAEKLEQWEPKPDPLVEMQKKLEINLLQAQIAKEEALAMKHSTEAEYHYHIQNTTYLNQYYIIFPGDYQGTPNAIQ